MTIRTQAVSWLKMHFPDEMSNVTRASKYFPDQELWFFTFPEKFFKKDDKECLNILCQHESNKDDFHLFVIPFSFIKANKDSFDLRKSGESFDLHISARSADKFSERRGHGRVDFSKFKIN